MHAILEEIPFARMQTKDVDSTHSLSFIHLRLKFIFGGNEEQKMYFWKLSLKKNKFKSTGWFLHCLGQNDRSPRETETAAIPDTCTELSIYSAL